MPETTQPEDVQFRSKSSWQKDDCINNHADHVCPNESTIEAVYGISAIRCCIEEDCRKRAAEIARTLKIPPISSPS